MPLNERSMVFSPVAGGTSKVQVRTENTLKLAKGKWYKLEFDLKTSDTANTMSVRFYTGTAWPAVAQANHLWSLAPSGSPSVTYWLIAGMFSTAKSYYQTWDTVTRYVLSDTDSEVYLHFEVNMKRGTDNYAVKLDDFALTRVGTEFADVTDPSTTWADVDKPTTEFADVATVTTDWSDV